MNINFADFRRAVARKLNHGYKRFPVMVSRSRGMFLEDERRYMQVTAKTAAEAANWVRDTYDWPENTRITVVGVKGGLTERFIGMETWVWRKLSSHREAYQPEFPTAAEW